MRPTTWKTVFNCLVPIQPERMELVCRDAKKYGFANHRLNRFTQFHSSEVVMFFEVLNHVDSALSVAVSLLALWQFLVAGGR